MPDHCTLYFARVSTVVANSCLLKALAGASHTRTVLILFVMYPVVVDKIIFIPIARLMVGFCYYYPTMSVGFDVPGSTKQ